IQGVSGRARVEARPAITKVQVSVEGFRSPSHLGAELITYVLWAVSPEGHAANLGEITFGMNGKGSLKSTTELQSFSLFVTAEPYSTVRIPSELVVLENQPRKGTKGRVFVVKDYKLMRRTQYQKLDNPLALSMDLKNVPLQMYEARNSIEIAKSRAADRYAPEIYSKAEASLHMAENALAAQSDKRQVVS